MLTILLVVLFAALATLVSFLAHRYLAHFGDGHGEFYDTTSRWHQMGMHLWLAATFGALVPLLGLDTVKSVTLGLAAGLLACLFVVDLNERLLPNRVNWACFYLIVTGQIVSTLVSGRWNWFTLIAPLVAGGLTAGFYALVRLIPRTGIGLGDVKLALTTGTVLAWVGAVTHTTMAPLYGVLVAYLVFGLQVVVPVITKKVDIKTAKAPFGPAMIISTLLVCAWFGIPAALS